MTNGVNNYYKEDKNILIDEFNKIIHNSELENTMINVTEWVDCLCNMNKESELPKSVVFNFFGFFAP